MRAAAFFSALVVLACSEPSNEPDASPMPDALGADAPRTDAPQADAAQTDATGSDVGGDASSDAPGDAGTPRDDAGDAGGLDASDAATNDAGAPCVALPAMEVGTLPNFNIPVALAVSDEGFVHATSTTAAFGPLPFHSNGSGTWVTESLRDDSFDYRAGSISIIPRRGGSVYLLGIGVATNASGMWEYGVPGGSYAALDQSGAIHYSDRTNLVSYETGVAVATDMGTQPCLALAIDGADLVHSGHCERNPPLREVQLSHVVEDGAGGFVRTPLGSARETSLHLAADAHAHFVYTREGVLIHVEVVGGAVRENILPDTDEVQAIAAHNGAVHILQGRFNTGVKYTTNASGEYVTTTLIDRFVEGLAAISVDDDDRVHIAYQGQYVGGKRVYYQRLCLP